MKRKRIDKTINFTDAELFEIYSNNESLSIVAKILFGSDVYSCRERVKRLAEEKNLPLPQKKKEHFYCAYCGKEIPKGKKFCNHSCAASYNNKGTIRNGQSHYCKQCGKKMERSRMFCSQKCKEQYEINEIIAGKRSGLYNNGSSMVKYYRDYIIQTRGCQCEICGWNEVNPYTGNHILQIHHKDGDCTNNLPANLEVLCPNHHAMTDNFGSRNKNSTRVDRRTKYFRKNIEIELSSNKVPEVAL